MFNKKDSRNARWNCRDKKRWPLNGNCFVHNVIYEYTVETKLLLIIMSVMKGYTSEPQNWIRKLIVPGPTKSTLTVLLLLKILMTKKRWYRYISHNRKKYCRKSRLWIWLYILKYTEHIYWWTKKKWISI